MDLDGSEWIWIDLDGSNQSVNISGLNYKEI